MIFHSLTFTRSRGRCWKPRAKPEFFDTSWGTLRTLMNDKIMFARYYCINSTNTTQMETIIAQFYLFALTCNCLLTRTCFLYLCSIRAVVRFSWLFVLTWRLSTCSAWRPGTTVNKVTKPGINSTWIALLINGFLSVKTWLLNTCGINIYAIIVYNIRRNTRYMWGCMK